METIKIINSGDYLIKLYIKLEDKDQKNFDILKKLKKPAFSVSAMVWRKWAEECGGQCLDEINEILKKNGDLTKERAIIYYLRENYHLNDTHAGTKKQEKRLKAHNINNRANNYSETCKALEDAWLLIDEGVKFWSIWHYWGIPAEDLREIKKFFIN